MNLTANDVDSDSIIRKNVPHHVHRRGYRRQRRQQRLFPCRQYPHSRQQHQYHLQHIYFSSSSSSLSPPPARIYIAQECLLIPVAFGLWWYWTKRTARKVYKRLLRIAPACSENDDDDDDDDDNDNDIDHYDASIILSPPSNSRNNRNSNDEYTMMCDAFQSWNDVEASCANSDNRHNNNNNDTTAASSSSSMRLVRWIKTSTSSPLAMTRNSTSRKERQVRIMTLQNLRKQPPQPQTFIRSSSSQLSSHPQTQTQTQSPPYYPDPSSWECIPDTTHPYSPSLSTSAFPASTSYFYQRMEDLCYVNDPPPYSNSEATTAGTTTTLL